ncbi:lysine--tRNA ligase [Candidatus Zinderia endosymbiont of Aphrophora alni]|uniref:lysine--tRNA ligase n=1 Tax=Candidatus Zinderia endosymbiont of Aphrophora alni TaxID=3077951 RepID=UPI0030D5FC36
MNIFSEINNRKKKLDLMISQGFNFPNNFIPKNKTYFLCKKYNNFDKLILEKKKINVSIAGRIFTKRIFGKAIFALISDFSGSFLNGKIQIYINYNILGKIGFNNFKNYDLGDIIGVCGILFKTNTNELTIKVNKILFINKSIHQISSKFYGLSNKEIKYRKRYLDLIINPKVRLVFKIRSSIISFIRKFLEKNDFLEVETPMFHKIPGGASAKPFITYHNSLNMKMFLRVSPELFLKKLIVGGFNRIFEINRNFRNEGLSIFHNPEFTMLEFYSTYVDYKWLMIFIEKIFKKLTFFLYKKNIIKYREKKIDFSKPFKRFTIIDAILNYTNYTIFQLNNISFLYLELKKISLKLNKKIIKNLDMDLYQMQLILFDITTKSKIINPTYIIDYPVSVSPLARLSNINKNITERFELFIYGCEIANGFSELNDSKEQSKRFLKQIIKHKNINIKNIKKKTFKNNKYYDKDYINALEYGMPPTAGCGIGIDRLVMILTNSFSIKDVILFPYLRNI